MQIKIYVFKDIRFISDLCSITCLFLIALVAAGLKGHCPLVSLYGVPVGKTVKYQFSANIWQPWPHLMDAGVHNGWAPAEQVRQRVRPVVDRLLWQQVLHRPGHGEQGQAGPYGGVPGTVQLITGFPVFPVGIAI